MTKASDNIFAKFKIAEGTAWATPTSGQGVMYAKSSDSLLYYKNDAGTEYTLSQTAGGAPSVGTAFTRTGGNYTTTATSFGTIDAANLAGTVVFGGAHRALVFIGGAISNNLNTTSSMLDIEIDGTRVGGTLGIVYYDQHATAGESIPFGYTYMSSALSAGTHTFVPMWRVGGGTATLAANGNIPFHFWVQETNIS